MPHFQTLSSLCPAHFPVYIDLLRFSIDTNPNQGGPFPCTTFRQLRWGMYSKLLPLAKVQQPSQGWKECAPPTPDPCVAFGISDPKKCLYPWVPVSPQGLEPGVIIGLGVRHVTECTKTTTRVATGAPLCTLNVIILEDSCPDFITQLVCLLQRPRVKTPPLCSHRPMSPTLPPLSVC